ncbi:MAG TPA: sensor domain-containing diguanylate cyclase, partial [Solirubrobacteraceae bacterium]|nr:sensor domain-containing diguanylate cyclase [Solirubrobacteraceae bacterium]
MRPGSLERWIWGGTRAGAIAGLIVALGLAISAFVAVETRTNAEEANRKSFESTAAALSSTVDSKLDVNIGLTRTMRSLATLEPNAGESRFLQWYEQLQRGRPSTNGVHAALIQPVLASGLEAFKRQAAADPAFRAVHAGKFDVLPSGERPVYCLTRALVGTNTAANLSAPLLDYCAKSLPGVGRSPYPMLVRAATDTGSFIVTTVPDAEGQTLAAIGAAVYRLGAPRDTVKARRAAMTGVIGTSFDSVELIRSVLAGRSSLTLALYHQNIGGPLQLVGRAGASTGEHSPSYTRRTMLPEGWMVEASGAAATSPSPTAKGFIALALGLLVTLLLFLLYRVLSRSRQRAWTMVGEKTGELEYSALHDPLTDLPNRDLVLDRAEQILARGRRLDVPVTALFMDVDGLKQINDRHGHRVGDEVLRQVAARLKTTLRDSDTVGRFGGDEF